MNQVSTRENGKNVIGLTIQLQKYGVGKYSHDSNQVSELILGHYDNLLITPVKKWLEYSPESDWDLQLPDGGITNYLATHYPIKLLFPSQQEIQGMDSFCYDKWRTPEKLLSSMPCMTLVLLNLTDSYKERNKRSILKSFLTLLSADDRIKAILDQISCCVLPCIGYSDFCILMAGTSWKPAIEIVEYLHGLTVEDSIPVLSTDYMMPIYHSRVNGFKANCFKDIELSVRVNLKPGSTARMLAQCVPKAVRVYRTSGGSDCLLYAKTMKSQKQLLDFLLGKKQTGNFVIDMASTLQFPLLPAEGLDPTLHDECSTDPKINISEFNEAIRQYEQQLIKKMRHRRQANSLRELAASVVNVCSQRHNADMREIVVDLISDFTYSLNQCTEGMRTEMDWDCDEMELRVGEFCRIVNSFLTDLSRSDCFYMEQEKYSHSSVSSATSLLIAYNQWLNDFTDAVRKATQPNNQSDYAFLVTSGGIDQTETIDAFHFLKPKTYDGELYERIPLITHMSEMSLFDFSGTILRSVHECMHFCGTRLREERVGHITSFVSMWLAKKIAETLFTKENTYDYVKEVYTSLCADVDIDEESDELLKEARQQYGTFLDKLKQSVFAKFMEYFQTPYGLKEPKDYLARNIREWMYDILLEAFAGYVYTPDVDNNQLVMRYSPLSALMYNETQRCYAEFYSQSDILFKKYEIGTAIFSFEENKQILFSSVYNDECKYDVDRFLSKQIQLILSRMLVSIPPYSLPDSESEEYTFWKLKFPYITLTKRNVWSVLEIATDVFSETFADVMACSILKVSIEDYMMMHVYEDWNLDSALGIEAAKTYRVPAVLRLCFARDLEVGDVYLTQNARKRIAEAVLRYKEHGGMKNSNLDAEKVCCRIEDLLHAFKEDEPIGLCLIRYLEKCILDYKSKNVLGELDEFAQSFQQIRLLSITPNQDTTHDALIEMYYALVNRRGDMNGKNPRETEMQ